MTKFVFKKLPKGYSFPLTKKSVRALVSECGAAFDFVTFQGLSSSEGRNKAFVPTNTVWVGVLAGHREDGAWSFSLEINGLRNQTIDNVRSEVTRVLAADIADWTRKKRDQAPNTTVQPNRLFLAFRNDGGAITSASHEVEWRFDG